MDTRSPEDSDPEPDRTLRRARLEDAKLGAKVLRRGLRPLRRPRAGRRRADAEGGEPQLRQVARRRVAAVLRGEGKGQGPCPST